MTTTTMQDTARALASAFETATRPDGTPYVRLREGAPQWMADAVRVAHDGVLPNDWIYQACQEAADALAEALEYEEDLHDAASEHAHSRTDIYPSDLCRWLADVVPAQDYCGEAMSYGLVDVSQGIIAVLQAGQYEHRCAIFDALRCAVASQVEASDDA